MAYFVVRPAELEYQTRPHEVGEAPRHAAPVTEQAGLQNTRATFFRYEPGAKGRRHDDKLQEETYVPVSGTMTMYLATRRNGTRSGRGVSSTSRPAPLARS